MSTPASLLIELLTEELPPKSLRILGDAFAEALVKDLRTEGLTPATGAFTAFATPRRLAVLIRDVAAKAPDRIVVAKGPSVKAGLDANGAPSQALQGFAKKQGVTVQQLERQHDGKQDVFIHRSMAPGALLDEILADRVAAALKKLPIPKMMRWGDTDYEFVRPVCGLVMLHGERIVPGKILGQSSGRTTRGHRFLGRADIQLSQAEAYEESLATEGKVIASFAARAQKIRALLGEAAQGAVIAADDALFEEVTALVEWPAVYAGTFDSAFLAVPQECLILTMQANQKYFPLVDDRQKLLNRFLLVSNMAIADATAIVRGNERVLRARLSDARFFFDQDRKERLAKSVGKLAGVVYHNKLGSQLERTTRIEHLAEVIAGLLKTDTSAARLAGHLCKADLLTGMVGEFPELQGTMGRYYALHDGEAALVASAIETHYRPRFAGDTLPDHPVGDAVALAEKLDTLVGIYGIGLAPTGDRDPFALRRAALGALRILSEHALPLDLPELLRFAHDGFARGILDQSVETDVYQFMLERLRSYLRDRDFAPDEIESVVDQMPARIDLVIPRLDAVRAFRKLPQAVSLAAANKRIGNILKKSGVADTIDPQLLTDVEERALFEQLVAMEPAVGAQIAAQQFAAALRSLADARDRVDAFFDKVLVNAEDPKLRNNRLALLTRLNRLMNQVADISKLAS
ncbi:MAG: glycine--tRNA ligase subunit beta [Betaproteobacteria bacterium]|nr:glycine--tRNA ligase subunit beta [Betaproteobacteria bacterium]